MGPRNPVFVVGGARSGTTFLAKLLDSHPDVLYRHEPDSVRANTDIPFVPHRDDMQRFVEPAGRYLEELRHVSATKVSGQGPFFDKSYRSGLKKKCFLAGLYLAKVAERLGGSLLPKSMPIPDCLDRGAAERVVHLIKSVDSPWRTTLFSDARPEWRFIHIVRHPCAVVNSRLRGIESKLMASNTYLQPPFEAGMAEGYPFSLEEMEASSYEEKAAFLWMICNQTIHDDMAGRESYRMVVYDDLCRNLEETTRALFDFAGLSWDTQAQDFIRNLESQDAGKAGYFNIMRPPLASLDKWREQFSGEQIAKIERIVCHSAVGRRFFDEATDPSEPAS